MRKFELLIHCNNDAFANDNERYELARILREAAASVQFGNEFGSVKDINGNTVGFYKLGDENGD